MRLLRGRSFTRHLVRVVEEQVPGFHLGARRGQES